MPNYVYNTLYVYGNGKKSQRDIILFLNKHIVDNYFDFNTVIPEPTNPSECEDEYNFYKTRTEEKDEFDSVGKSWFNWFDWRRKYWGVKWNAGFPQYFDYKKILNSDNGYRGRINILFTTPWAPPLPVIKKLIEMHPELNIYCEYYSIENMEYGFIGKDNEEIVHECYKIENRIKKEIL